MLDARRSKCVSYVPRCALARHRLIQMHFPCAQRRSRSTPIDPNAFPMCSNVLSLDACRSKCVSNVLKCALARRLSIQMHFLCAQMRSQKISKVQMSFRSQKSQSVHMKKSFSAYESFGHSKQRKIRRAPSWKLPSAESTRRAQPFAELSPSERSEDSAVNRALRARIRRKLEAAKQEAIQLPRLNCLGRRESVLSTYGI